MPITENPRPAWFDARLLEFMPFIRRRASLLRGDSYTKDDLIQETIASALARWENYRDDYSMATWLRWQMGAAVEALTKRRRRAGSVMPCEAVIGAATSAQESAVMVAQIMEKVAAGKHASTLERLAAGDRPYEIAAQDGVSRQSVHNRIDAARRVLAKRLGMKA